MSCQQELGHPSFEPIFAPYYEERLAPIRCSRGHESMLMLQSLKFEVLLESGAAALAAGFTLEAAASFSAALERFFEFCTRTMLIHQGMSASDIEPVFSEMSRQSERQLGAFLVLHRLVLGTAYSPSKKIVEFRNAVIHKGQIPTPMEVDDFCTRVYSEILRTTQALKTCCGAAIQSVVSEDMRARVSKLPTGTKVATMAGGSFFSLISETNPPDFKSAFEGHKKWADLIAQALPHMELLNKALPPRPTDA
jgi:hypothetical protein